jgi:hypothetical protein
MPPGLGKKPVVMASNAFSNLFSQVSKAALIDALWCACQLGTDESREQILTQAARNMVIALRERGDRVPPDIQHAADLKIDSDGDAG